MSIRLLNREKKFGHRRIGNEGETTFKRITSNQIMGSIQLGIQYAVGGSASKIDRDVLFNDFQYVETKLFANNCENLTPAHRFPPFSFKIYAPMAFRYFRNVYGIQPDDFMLSFCCAPLRELSSLGASGSLFYVTDDNEFIIKTVSRKEAHFLRRLLAGCYMNVVQNPRTLLPKFYGLYCYHCNSKNIRLVVMNNLFPSWIEIREKYDLKGSTYKRKATPIEREKSCPTYKDLDFMEFHPNGIILEHDIYDALFRTIQRDCTVLESFNIMDYSLLIGLHYVTKKNIGSGVKKNSNEPGTSYRLNENPKNKKKNLINNSSRKEIIDKRLVDQEINATSGGIPARSSNGEDLLLFIGIIDILQSYEMMKKLEHTLKSMFFDSETISVHRPDYYASRFINFIKKTVFKRGDIGRILQSCNRNLVQSSNDKRI